jgi:hypothetical protein
MKTNVSKWTTALAVIVGGALLATSAMAQSGAAYPPAKSSPDTTKSDAPKADTKSSAPQADTSKSPSSPAATTGSTAGETKPGAMKSDTTKSDAPKADTKSSAPQADTSKSPSSPAATTGSAAGETKPGAMKSDAMKSGPVQDSAQGADREQVKAVQQALKDKGHDPGEVDGAMGPKTEAALRDYQKKEGLKATGTADAETMAKLTASANLPAASPSAGSTGTSKDATSPGAKTK